MLTVQRVQASNGIRFQAETSGCDSHPDSSVGHDICGCVRASGNLVYRFRYCECLDIYEKSRLLILPDPVSRVSMGKSPGLTTGSAEKGNNTDSIVLAQLSAWGTHCKS